MASHEQNIENLRTAVYGEEVRQSMIELFDEDYETFNTKAAEAAASARAAALSETAAADSEENAEAWAAGTRDGTAVESGDDTYHNNSKYYSEQAELIKEDAEAYAVGTRDGTPVGNADVTYHNNSKYYSELAAQKDENAEAWAVGKRGGVDVGSTDATYHNNSKYYSEQAAASATTAATDAVAAVADDMREYVSSASGSASAAATSEENSEAWAVGERGGAAVPSSDETYENNAKYYADWVKNAFDRVLPTLSVDPVTGLLSWNGGALNFIVDNTTGYLNYSF